MLPHWKIRPPTLFFCIKECLRTFSQRSGTGLPAVIPISFVQYFLMRYCKVLHWVQPTRFEHYKWVEAAYAV